MIFGFYALNYGLYALDASSFCLTDMILSTFMPYNCF